LLVMVQPSLHKDFEAKCNEEHRTVSEVVRELMSKYSKGWIQLPEKEYFMSSLIGGQSRPGKPG